ncbi:MAG TPA: hypothetical protein VFQ45_01790 [Longimicrobium sp.]|nr:hypothetical protein [Longimicrobium sp.]
MDEEAAIDRGLREVQRLAPAAADAEERATLEAYRGALVTLRARHAFWPRQKLRHVREGLAVLDAVVAAHPRHAEARYLRLVSCYYLPRFLGRGWSVREDFARLGALLPSVRGRYPRDLYAAITRFVLDHGRPSPEVRRALEASLEGA